jgi:biotin transport system permease protein/energy-coupling factor transport system permease protein
MYNFGQYIPQKSPVHDLDPRVKIIAVLALSLIILQVDIIGLLGVTAMGLICVRLARIPVTALLKTLRPVLPFFGCLFLLYIFFTPGRPLPLFPIGPVQISYEGLYIGLQQVGKFILLVASASILTMTTPASEITMGLERLLRPLRIVGVSSHDVAMMISLALRFFPTLVDEIKSIREAHLARGANLNAHTLSGKVRTIIYLAGPLATNILRRCDQIVDAMEARGYQQGSRTYLRELALTRADYFIIIVLVIAVLVPLVGIPCV